MDIVAFYKHVLDLKQVKRTGWVNHGIKKSESVADHSYGLSVLAMVYGKKFKRDVEKMVKMALIHDLGECIIGDIVAYKGGKVDAGILAEKLEKEDNATREILAMVDSGNELIALWEEFSKSETAEAKLVHDLDKLDAVLQADYYEKKFNKSLEEFFAWGVNHIADTAIRDVVKKLLLGRLQKLQKEAKS